jgi:hypothetical protein
MGGNIDHNKSCDLVEKYDSLTDTWTEMAPMYDISANHCAALVGKKIYVIGGGDIIERGIGNTYVQVYDILENLWTFLDVGITASNAQTCVSGTNIYLFGGKDYFGEDNGDVKKFNTVTHVWTTLALKFALDPSADESDVRLRGSVNKVGEDIYLTSPDGGDIFLFDPKKETISLVESRGTRVGGYTYVLDGCIYDVFWTYLGRTDNVVSKGTIDDDDGITWTRVETLPGAAREMFGTASITTRDVLHVAINRLK